LEHLEVLRSTGEVARSIWENWVLLLDRFPFCRWSIKAPSFFDWVKSIPDYSEPVPVSTSQISTPSTLNVWAFFLAAQSAPQWLYPPQFKHLSSANLIAFSSAEILLLSALRCISAGAVYLATVPAWVPEGSLGEAGSLGDGSKSVPPPCFYVPSSTRYCWIWLFCFWPTVTNAGTSSCISPYVNMSFISWDTSIWWAFHRAKGCRSSLVAITWNWVYEWGNSRLFCWICHIFHLVVSTRWGSPILLPGVVYVVGSHPALSFRLSGCVAWSGPRLRPTGFCMQTTSFIVSWESWRASVKLPSAVKQSSLST